MSDSENNTTINGEEFILTVECGTNTAKLHLSKLRQGSRAACVMFEDRWLSPNQFQCVSGRRTTKVRTLIHTYIPITKHVNNSIIIICVNNIISFN